MPRLPSDGDLDWGRTLNEFLRTSHNEDGSLKNSLKVINVKDFGAVGNGITDDTIAIQRALDIVETMDPKGSIVFFPQGKYLISQILIPDGGGGRARVHVVLQGAYSGSQLIQIENARGKDMVVTKSFVASSVGSQDWCTIKDLTFIGHSSGGSTLHLNNIVGAFIEGCHFLGGGANAALIRIRRCNKITIHKIRLHSKRSGDISAKYGLWIGENGDRGDNSNIWIKDVESHHEDAEGGYPLGHAIFIDGRSAITGERNRNGGIVIENMKLDGMTSREAAVKILSSSGIRLINTGVEYQQFSIPVITEYARTGNSGQFSCIHIENSKFIYADRSAFGSPFSKRPTGISSEDYNNAVNKTASLKIINSQGIRWENSSISGSINNAILMQGGSDHFLIENCFLFDRAGIGGVDAVNPKMIVKNCRETDNSGNIIRFDDSSRGFINRATNNYGLEKTNSGTFKAPGDLELKSPNGRRWKVFVDNSGNLRTEEIRS